MIRCKLPVALALNSALLLLLLLTFTGLADNFTITYHLLRHVNSPVQYSLNVVVPESLYDYYLQKSHVMTSENGFAKFVTPYALKPIADSLTDIYTDDEDYVNAVLMIVHQIPYEVTTPSKYPVETIQENKGDCDLFSYIAASILKAAGLTPVLLYYEQEAHMNIGVSLSHVPNDSRGEVFYITENNVRYYPAECTGGNWQDGWRVGECPDELKRATAQIISLDQSEQTAVGQVSASYKTLSASTLALTSSTAYTIQGGSVALSGQLSPELQGQNITIYFRVNNSPWAVLGSVATYPNGRFEYAWNVNTGGICYVRASWSGDDNFAAADSPTLTITSMSTMFFALMIGAVIMTAIGAVAYLMTRHSGPQEVPEPQPPEIPEP